MSSLNVKWCRFLVNDGMECYVCEVVGLVDVVLEVVGEVVEIWGGIWNCFGFVG